MVKVSVIIPVYNVKNYLKECMDSVLKQTLQEIEIICGDGGSNDGSLEILQEYAASDPRVRIISKKGSGYGQSVNDCIDIATGEYVGIVESDDKIAPNMYEKLYSMAKEKDLDWVRGDIYYYYAQKPQEDQLVRESIVYGKPYYYKVWNPQQDYEPYKSGLRTWSGIYRREFLNRFQIRHNETAGGSFQDVGFYLKTLYYATRVAFISEAFYYWRQDRDASSIHYDSKKLIDKSFMEWHLNQKYLEQHPELGKMQIGSYHYRQFFSYLWTIEMAGASEKKYACKIAYNDFKAAFQKNEIDKQFFTEDEWKRLHQEMKNWERGRRIQFDGKKMIKKILKPGADFFRKIVYKLMRDVIQEKRTAIDQLCHQNIQLKKKLEEGNIKQLQLRGMIEEQNKKQNEEFSMLEKMFREHGDLAWKIHCRTEDIHNRQRDAEARITWNMFYEMHKDDIVSSLVSSPLYDVAFYLANRYGSVISAQHILPQIFQKYPHESVVDFGCGSGTWLFVAKALGANHILGLDGEYVPKSLLMIPSESFLGCNLEEKISLNKKFDLAMSLEVAEHLSPEAADIFVKNIADSSDVVLFSAAHPGQGGDGHVNEQPKEYWIKKFARHGFRMIEVAADYESDTKIEFWYRDNIMLFVREEKL